MKNCEHYNVSILSYHITLAKQETIWNLSIFVDYSPWTISLITVTLQNAENTSVRGIKERLRDSIKLAFGTILHKYRLQQHLSQEKLAELANLDRTYISQIERGLKSPSIQTLFALAQALHIKAYLLISEVENELEIASEPGKVKE